MQGARYLASIISIAAFLLIGVGLRTGMGQVATGDRVALVIANGNYPDVGAPAATPGKDADQLAGELARHGFRVLVRKDLTKQDMDGAIAEFMASISANSTALFYFNGFGIEVGRQTYLLPVNAQIWSEADVKRDGIGLDAIVAQLNNKGARTKIAIIDASRRNPFERRFRAYSAGLAGIDAPEGSLVLYADAPGKIGKDSGGDVSLFMTELTRRIRQPGVGAEEAFMQTRLSVSRATNRQQVPWVASLLTEPFSFALPQGPPKVAATPAPPATPPTPPPTRPNAAPTAAQPPRPPTGAPPAAPPPTANASRPPPTVPPSAAPAVAASGGAAATTPSGVAAGAKTFADCSKCPEMIVIPSGSFDMGTGTTPYDQPVHRVTIANPFAMSRSAITFANWDECVTGGGCRYRPGDEGWGGGERPVINLSWLDTKDYVAWLSRVSGHPYRLASEAEWEYAARGGARTTFSWGAAVGSMRANCKDCGNGLGTQTMPSRSFAPNGFGLFDMAGNAAEWVEDCWNDNYYGAPRDGSAWTTGSCSQRVLRGGSFDTTAAYIKPSARFRYDADVRYFANGFRVVRSAP